MHHPPFNDLRMISGGNPTCVADPHVVAGNDLQLRTRNTHGVIDGTVLLVIVYFHPADARGRFVKVRFGGCSEPSQSALYDFMCSSVGPPKAVARSGACLHVRPGGVPSRFWHSLGFAFEPVPAPSSSA